MRSATAVPVFQRAFAERTTVEKVQEWSVLPDGSGVFQEPEQDYAEVMSIHSDHESSSSSETSSRPSSADPLKANSTLFKPRAQAALPMLDEADDDASSIASHDPGRAPASTQPPSLIKLPPKELFQLMKQAPIKPRQVVPTNESPPS
jgi:hypothetical protein